MRRFGLCLMAMVLCAAASALARAQPPQDAVVDPATRYSGHKVVRVHPKSVREMRTVLALTDDVWTCGFGGEADSPQLRPADIDVRLTPDALAALQASGVVFHVLIEDVQALIDAEQRGTPPVPGGVQGGPPLRGGAGFGVRVPGFFAAYQDLPTVSAYVDTLVALRPDMASRLLVGQSLELRQIFAIRISAPGAPAGSKPAIVITACQHAREWITVMSAAYLADQLVRNYDSDAGIRRLLDNFEFYIVPVLNPDGYAFSWTPGNRLWRKNRRANADGSFGVDLNRNWGQDYGLSLGSSGTPASEIYRGTAAFSEPCAAALRDFIIARPHTVLAIDVHSYGQLILEPRGADWMLPEHTRAYTQISGAMQAAMNAPEGQVYVAGETYRAIYPVSGAIQDWIALQRGVLALGCELRDRGTFILPIAQLIPASIEATAGITAAANWVLDNSIGAWFPATRPTAITAGGTTNIRVQFARGLKVIGDFTTHVPMVKWRIGRSGAFTSAPLTNLGSDEGGPVFSHTLPAGPCGAITQWYYELPLPEGGVATAPLPGANAPYEASARGAATVFADDFESAGAWTVGDFTPGMLDTASVGTWIRADPSGTIAQTEYDCTPLAGNTCFITGDNARGNVNGGRLSSGKTTLNSPLFDGSAAAVAGAKLDVSFWLWTFTSQTNAFRADATNNASSPTPTWTTILTIGPTAPIAQTTGRWVRHTIRLSDFVAPTSAMRVRFVAIAATSSTVVEVALDDVVVNAITCEKTPCAADFNFDGAAAVSDIFFFLSLWFSGDPRANVVGPTLDVGDIFAFLTTWFAGCP